VIKLEGKRTYPHPAYKVINREAYKEPFTTKRRMSSIVSLIRKVVDTVLTKHEISAVDLITTEILMGLGLESKPKKVRKSKKKDSDTESETASEAAGYGYEAPVVTAAVAVAVSPGFRPSVEPSKKPDDEKIVNAESKAVVESEKSDEKKERKRVVSKKMKETFMSLEGATEESLKEVIKKYKDAEEVTDFVTFAKKELGVVESAAPVVEKVTKPKAEKVVKPKAKKEETGRIQWNATSTRLFKTIVEESGGVLKDGLKTEFSNYLDLLTEDNYGLTSIQGHMRVFMSSKFPTPEPTLKDLPALKVSTEDSNAEVETEGEKDEDQEELEFEGETLWIGVSSGKIFRQTEEAGDVLVGMAGKGRFSKVVKPSA